MLSATARIHPLSTLAIVAAMAIACSASAQDADQPLRNAIFNGDFLQGRAGWSIGGPADLEVKTFRTMIADKADAELSLRHEALAETMTLFSQYPIGVEPGKEYTLTLTAAGEGTITFGVYEYGEREKNTIFPISGPITLTAEPQRYEFVYAASERALTIRPRIRIIGQAPPAAEPQQGDAEVAAGSFHVRLLNFALMLPQDVFAQSTDWPAWAVSDEFKSYTGLSEEEIARIKAATAVDRVLPPYEPIRAEHEGVYSLTTSQFDFGGSVFPEQITILGEPVLAGPIGFELRSTGGRALTHADGAAAFKATDRRVVAAQTARGDGWSLKMTSGLEYDALLIIDLELQADEPMVLRSGSLTIPLSREVGEYIRYNSAGAFGEGPIPAAGETVEVRHTSGRARLLNDWSPVAPAPEQGTLWEWTRGAPMYFWLGDEQKGIGWVL